MSQSSNKFKIDPHIHTSEVSHCGHLPAEEIVRRYKALGYHGIVITDHLYKHFVENNDYGDDWDAYVAKFLEGYRKAKAAGDKCGLKVLLGAEIRFLLNDSDYLLYGIDEEFLRANPFIYKLDPREFYARFGDRVLIIQAHPYRNKNEILLDCIHGVEVFNGNPRHDSQNETAAELCKKCPHLHAFSGSDTHEDGDEGSGWMVLDEVVEDSKGFRDVVVRRGYVCPVLNCEKA